MGSEHDLLVVVFGASNPTFHEPGAGRPFTELRIYFRFEHNPPAGGPLPGSEEILFLFRLQDMAKRFPAPTRENESKGSRLRALGAWDPGPCNLIRKIKSGLAVVYWIGNDSCRPPPPDRIFHRLGRLGIRKDELAGDIQSLQRFLGGVPDPNQLGGDVGVVAIGSQVEHVIADVGQLHLHRFHHPKLRRAGVVRRQTPTKRLFYEPHLFETRVFCRLQDVVDRVEVSFRAALPGPVAQPTHVLVSTVPRNLIDEHPNLIVR